MSDAKDLRAGIVPDILAILPLRGSVLMPHAVLPLGAGRASSVRLIEEAVQSGRLVGAVMQRDAKEDAPDQGGLFPVGTVTIIHKAMKQGDGSMRLVVQGLGRFRVLEIIQREPYLRARVEAVVEAEPSADVELEALVRGVRSLFEKVISLSPGLPDELVNVLGSANEPGPLADLITASVPTLSNELKQELLETFDVRTRLQKLIGALAKEAEVAELGSKIQSEVQAEVSKSQREYFLREQLKAIQKELGEDDERTAELERTATEDRRSGDVGGSAQGGRERELDRLSTDAAGLAEYTVAPHLPRLAAWRCRGRTRPPTCLDLARARDDPGRGSLRTRQGQGPDPRIPGGPQLKIDRRARADPRASSVLPAWARPRWAGPSRGRWAASSSRLSLGGCAMKPKSADTGARTSGALPGRIMQGLRSAGSNNPVFMLDEIDKLGQDFRGDPASALLEVLDPEQNATFRDHYLDVAFDLSRVLFITTANVLDPVPPALRDRMEIIELAGYTEEEKVAIARRTSCPSRCGSTGWTERHIRFTDDAVREMARGYTREAGVRNLEREIASVCRKEARRRADGRSDRPGHTRVASPRPRYAAVRVETQQERRGRARRGHGSGVDAARWRHPVRRGGPDARTGRDTLTGQAGEVMKESAKAALSGRGRCRRRSESMPPRVLAPSDVHVHVPAGAIPKDGPSAGATMVDRPRIALHDSTAPCSRGWR